MERRMRWSACVNAAPLDCSAARERCSRRTTGDSASLSALVYMGLTYTRPQPLQATMFRGCVGERMWPTATLSPRRQIGQFRGAVIIRLFCRFPRAVAPDWIIFVIDLPEVGT